MEFFRQTKGFGSITYEQRQMSENLTIYFLRHGETTASRDNVMCGSGLNPDLTSQGKKMASAFAAAYKDTEFEAVFASPLLRTRETAAPICADLGITPILCDGLREIGYGRWEGRTYDQIQNEYHDDYLRWLADPAWYAPTGGELGVSIAHRALAVVEDIRNRYPRGKVLVVSHKGTIRVLICALLGIDIGRYRYRISCPVGSISVVEFTQHGPLMKIMADRTYMGKELRESSSE